MIKIEPKDHFLLELTFGYCQNCDKSLKEKSYVLLSDKGDVFCSEYCLSDWKGKLEFKKNHWKDIDDELPPYGQRVLLRTKVDGKCEYFEDIYRSDIGWNNAFSVYITHWCELPKGCPTCGRLN